MDTVTILYYIAYVSLLITGVLAIAIGLTCRARNRTERDAIGKYLDYIIELMSKKEE